MKIMRHAKTSIISFLSIFLFYFCFFVSFEKIAKAFPVEVSESPFSDLNLTLKAIESAQKSLLINMYEFTSQEISTTVVSRIKAGVKVQILLERQVVGGFSREAGEVQDQILDAMLSFNAAPENHFYQMTSKAGGERRFRFNHAKYIVIDDQSLLIGSENFTPNSQPVRGHLGSRGWEVWIHDLKMVNSFKQLFNSDINLSYGDIQELTNRSQFSSFTEDHGFRLRKGRIHRKGREIQPISQQNKPKEVDTHTHTYEAESSTQILSPDNSLDELSQMLTDAKDKIDLELMTFDSGWGKTTNFSPLLDSLLKAARNGVKVRVLLNDETVFYQKQNSRRTNRNLTTISLINEIAKRESLDIAGRIANLHEMNVAYIHNKGALIDGNQTLISSINWNQNSVQNNREAAVLLKSTGIYQHYESLFEKDWTDSASNLFTRVPASNFLYFESLFELLNQPFLAPVAA